MERKKAQRSLARSHFDYWAYCVDITTRMYANLIEEPPSDIIIQRNSLHHRWLAYYQDCSRLTVITPFCDTASPMTVTRWLRANANGPINVIWNL